MRRVCREGVNCHLRDRSIGAGVTSFSSSQIGISIAMVTLSLASMNRCRVSWRSLLLPTARMLRSAVCVAAFSLRFTIISDASAHGGVA